MNAPKLPAIDTLLIERDETNESVRRLTINRPAKRNSLDQQLIAALTETFEALDQDDSTRVIVLTGAGDHFCSGLFLDYLEKISKFGVLQNLKDSEAFLNLLLSIYRCRKPVIARVQGYALAGGCGIASACDLVIADDSAVFGYTETRFGFVPALVATFLIRRIGEGRARDLLLTARFIKAQEALQMGLANKVVKPSELEATVSEYAETLTKNSASSLALTKGMFEHLGSMSLQSSLDYARNLNALTRQTEDFKEGLAKFLAGKSEKK